MDNFRKVFSVSLIAANLILGIPALVIYLAPTLIVAGYFLLILPGLIMSVLPTLALYLLVFSLCWALLYRLHPGVAIALGAMAVWLVAMQLPQSFNRHTREELAEAEKRNVVTNAALPVVRTFALEVPQHRYTENCNDLCAMLLYNRQVERFILPPPYGEVSPTRKRRTKTVAYRIQEGEICPTEKRNMPRVAGAVIFRADFSEQIRRAVLTRMAGGECLVKEEIADGAADMTLRLIDERKTGRSGVRMGPLPVLNSGLELRVGTTPLAVELAQSSGQLLIPLHLTPTGMGGGTLTYSGWEWGQKRWEKRQIDNLAFLDAHTPFEYHIPTGGTGADVRQQLDRFLSGTSNSQEDVAGFLVGQYFQQMVDEGMERGDAQRLRRILADRRFDNFPNLKSLVRKQPAIQEPVLKAILARVNQEIGQEGTGQEPKKSAVKLLDEVVGAMSPDLFQRARPDWDAFLVNPKARAEATYLILRLVERGSAAAPTLLNIIATKPENVDAWGKDRSAAVRALCALGPAVREHLPTLRRYADEGIVGASTQRWITWKAMLVALGAPLAEFPEKEHRSIRDLAKSRCGYPQERQAARSVASIQTGIGVGLARRR
ncbi:MAG: hypothetical protein NW208_18970 [Bryobacter sp.]|nr:hypothetical protein [Bryobacter sp.]